MRNKKDLEKKHEQKKKVPKITQIFWTIIIKVGRGLG